MDEQYSEAEQNLPMSAYQLPSQLHKDFSDSMQLVKVLTDHDNFLDVIRREMRGEQLYQDESGETYWVQVDKPMFVKLDENDVPLKKMNQKTKKMEYMANDDAVNEIIGVLKSSGLNPIAPMTNIDENEIRADLLEIESKVAMLLTIKRKKWGIDKAEYPITVANIKTLIKDARYRAKDGTALKALRTITSRIEQARSQPAPKGIGERIKSPFA